jgi:hypothetical protein
MAQVVKLNIRREGKNMVLSSYKRGAGSHNILHKRVKVPLEMWPDALDNGKLLESLGVPAPRSVAI